MLSGRLTVQEGGEVFLGGRTYEVRRGTIDFTDPTRIEPTIDIALETRVQRYDITLEISGTPETIEASLQLSEAALVALGLPMATMPKRTGPYRCGDAIIGVTEMGTSRADGNAPRRRWRRSVSGSSSSS